ncbi:MFS transporter [Myxococcota bacterium]|nr:MFS transporter [Myxococcota bacterium]
MRPLLVIFLTVLVDLIGFGLVIPLLTFYSEAFGASAMQVTLLMACYSVAQFFFAPLWGALSDRWGRRPVLLLSIGAGTLMLAGFAASTELWMLFAFRTLHGVFAANLSVAQAYIADVTTPENRAKGMGLIGAAFGLGFTVGPWLGGELSVFGLAAPIWAAAALSALNFVLALALLPEPPSKGDRVRRVLDPAAVLTVLQHPSVGLAVLLTFTLTFSFAMMESTFALYEEHFYNLNAAQVGRALGVVGVVGTIVQGGLIGPVVRRFGEATLVRICVPGMGLTLFLLPYAPPWAALIAVLVALAVFNGFLNPSLSALISKGASASEQGAVLGTNQSLSALARATGPVLGGLLFSRVAMPASFLTAAGLLLASTALAWRATRPQAS